MKEETFFRVYIATDGQGSFGSVQDKKTKERIPCKTRKIWANRSGIVVDEQFPGEHDFYDVGRIPMAGTARVRFFKKKYPEKTFDQIVFSKSRKKNEV